MPIYKIKLLHRKEVAEKTVVFTFEKPAEFIFTPGQYAGFTLIHPPETDAGGNTRRFSLLSIPQDAHIRIVTRIQSSAFKRVLNTLPIGSELKLVGPSGHFTLHENSHIPAVFIAGGIGIAPFYSMIRHATYQHSTQELSLFYGNAQETHAAFLEEFSQLEKQNPKFKCILTMEHAHAHWKGHVGFITDALITKYLSSLTTPIYYICGSPAMVAALQTTLLKMGIDPHQMHAEDFPGY